MRTFAKVSVLLTAILIPIFWLLFVSAAVTEDGENVVNVYSHRHYKTDEMLIKQFSAETGITVNVVNANADELIQRIKQEGSRTPADLLITADAGHLYRAKQADLLQPFNSPTIEKLVPEQFRDKEKYWVGLTVRARAIVYDKVRSDATKLSTYEALATPIFANTIAIRSSSNIYNISLLASIIATHGKAYATEWAQGMLRSFARPPYGNDRDQIKAVAAGIAEYAVVNTYYLSMFFNSDEAEERNITNNLAVFFPNQNDRGTHVNISGAAITAHAKHLDAATKLLEFFLSKGSQEKLTNENFEYPVNPDVETHPTLAGWDDFKKDTLDLEQLGRYAEDASHIFDKVGWK